MTNRSGQSVMGRTIIALLTALALAPSGATAGSYGLRTEDGRIASLSAPEDCKMKGAKGENTMACSWQADDGGYRSIALQVATLSVKDFTRQFDIDRASFLENPKGYMEAVLRRMEELATGGAPAPGQKRIRVDAEIVRDSRTAAGMDKCLRFEFDWSGPVDNVGTARTDNSGMRCFDFDTDGSIITYVMLECMNTHLMELEKRQPAHQREADLIAGSLRLQ